jgi:hypothetical protein
MIWVIQDKTIQAILRHSNVSVTLGYLHQAAPERGRGRNEQN